MFDVDRFVMSTLHTWRRWIKRTFISVQHKKRKHTCSKVNWLKQILKWNYLEKCENASWFIALRCVALEWINKVSAIVCIWNHYKKNVPVSLSLWSSSYSSSKCVYGWLHCALTQFDPFIVAPWPTQIHHVFTLFLRLIS